jgi:hypothetical protein
MFIATLICGSEPENFDACCTTVRRFSKKEQQNSTQRQLIKACEVVLSSLTSGEFLSIPTIIETIKSDDAILKQIQILPK